MLRAASQPSRMLPRQPYSPVYAYQGLSLQIDLNLATIGVTFNWNRPHTEAGRAKVCTRPRQVYGKCGTFNARSASPENVEPPPQNRKGARMVPGKVAALCLFQIWPVSLRIISLASLHLPRGHNDECDPLPQFELAHGSIRQVTGTQNTYSTSHPNLYRSRNGAEATANTTLM